MRDDRLKLLTDLKKELTRFTEKLDMAILQVKDENNWSHKAYASAKRGALDLKNELTNLTQDARYIYGPRSSS